MHPRCLTHWPSSWSLTMLCCSFLSAVEHALSSMALSPGATSSETLSSYSRPPVATSCTKRKVCFHPFVPHLEDWAGSTCFHMRRIILEVPITDRGAISQYLTLTYHTFWSKEATYLGLSSVSWITGQAGPGPGQYCFLPFSSWSLFMQAKGERVWRSRCTLGLLISLLPTPQHN
jgi:hypothetical protein